MRLIGIAGIAGALLLSGCGLAAKIDARQGYQRAVVAYQGCLSTHQADTSACNADKFSMDAARQEYEEMTAGLSPGSIRSVNVGTSATAP